MATVTLEVWRPRNGGGYCWSRNGWMDRRGYMSRLQAVHGAIKAARAAGHEVDPEDVIHHRDGECPSPPALKNPIA